MWPAASRLSYLTAAAADADDDDDDDDVQE